MVDPAISENEASIIDLRDDYDEITYVEDGILYRKGEIVQVWWDKWGKETWTCPNGEQAKVNFDAMKERWSSSELSNPEPTGTCYEDAWCFFIKQEKGDAFLIHGTVQFHEGESEKHAWVELMSGWVWEPQSKGYFTLKDFEITCPVEEHRYTYEEATLLAIETMSHGPWSDEEREEWLREPD